MEEHDDARRDIAEKVQNFLRLHCPNLVSRHHFALKSRFFFLFQSLIKRDFRCFQYNNIIYLYFYFH